MMIFFNHKVPKKSIRYLIIISFLLASTYLHGQGEKKFIRQGNREYGKGKFPESETSYRRAIDKNKVSPDAVFNAGDALYKQKKYEEAGKQFIENSTMNEDKSKKASAMYNLGNSLLKSGKLQESIEAYKNSLKLNPQNMEAKYNLAYAQDLLKQQQDKQKQNQDKKDQNKDNKKDQNKDNKKDQNDKQNDRQKQQDQKDQQQQQQQQQQTISKDDAERLLNSIANDEKNVQEKVKLAKAMNSKVRTVKNW